MRLRLARRFGVWLHLAVALTALTVYPSGEARAETLFDDGFDSFSLGQRWEAGYNIAPNSFIAPDARLLSIDDAGRRVLDMRSYVDGTTDGRAIQTTELIPISGRSEFNVNTTFKSVDGQNASVEVYAIGSSGKVARWYLQPFAGNRVSWDAFQAGPSVQSGQYTFNRTQVGFAPGGQYSSVSLGLTGSGATISLKDQSGVTLATSASSAVRLNELGGSVRLAIRQVKGDIAPESYIDRIVAEGVRGTPILRVPDAGSPTRIDPPTVPVALPQEPGKRGLVFLTHGAASGKDAWARPLGKIIADRITGADVQPEDHPSYTLYRTPDWDVVAYDWSAFAGKGLVGGLVQPSRAALNAEQIGNFVGEQYAAENYDRFHLIAHSAGSWLVDAMAGKLQGSDREVQTTFLDAFTPLNVGLKTLGGSSDFAEQYFDRRCVPFTDSPLDQAFNADVTRQDTRNTLDPIKWHNWPIDYYEQVALNDSWERFGIPRPIELGGNPSHAQSSAFSRGALLTLPRPAGSFAYLAPTCDSVVRLGAATIFTGTGQSATGSVLFNGTQLTLRTGSPVWVAQLIDVDDAVNFITFDASFLGDIEAEGLLSVYWDGNLIGTIDERYTLDGMQHYTLELPGNYDGDFAYSLAFRLDPFTDAASSMLIDNVRIGYVQQVVVPEPSAIILCGLVAASNLLRRRPGIAA